MSRPQVLEVMPLMMAVCYRQEAKQRISTRRIGSNRKLLRRRGLTAHCGNCVKVVCICVKTSAINRTKQMLEESSREPGLQGSDIHTVKDKRRESGITKADRGRHQMKYSGPESGTQTTPFPQWKKRRRSHLHPSRGDGRR